MNRRTLFACGVALWVAGCSGQSSIVPAQLTGVQDLARVGPLLFVTSADSNELRALAVSQQTPDFVRAPNPIEPLSIPLSISPTRLARDIRWEGLPLPEGGALEGGEEVTGPYLYATSPGASFISIVNADDGIDPRLALRELVLLPTGGPVTAVAAKGPVGGQGASTLYYATSNAGVATLFELSVPFPTELPAVSADQLQATARAVGTFPGEWVRGLLVHPSGDLIVATRSEQGGGGGRTLRVSPTSFATSELGFPTPVRLLETHAGAVGLPAGQRIFAVLDEEGCTASPCGGILAVDADTGERVLDPTGNPMLPLHIRGGDSVGRLPMGLAVGARMSLLIPGGEVTELPLLGAVTTSTGELAFFDAVNLRLFDIEPSAPYHSAISFVTADGAVEQDPLHGIVAGSIGLTEGAVVDETVVLTFEGRIPGLTDLPTSDGDGLRFPAPPEQVNRARVGDLIEVSNANGPCPGEWGVSAVEPGALVVDAEGGGCPERTSYTVRARGDAPYLVTGTRTGYMGRVGAQQTFVYAGEYERREPGQFDPAQPQMRFEFGDPAPSVGRGAEYRFDIEDAFTPFLVTVAGTVDLSIGAAFYFADDVVLDSARQRAWVAYPSADAVVEFSTAAVVPGANERNVVSYR